MKPFQPRENSGSKITHITDIRMFAVLLFSLGLFFSQVPRAEAIINNTPWTTEFSLRNLVYGASSEVDVVRAMGNPPDEVVSNQQMYPPVENYYYYDKSGAATIFVFENGLLVGLQLKTAGDQYVDLTYFLTNNGDRTLNYPMMNGYMPYYPYFPLTAW